jgi:hypothetical protein
MQSCISELTRRGVAQFDRTMMERYMESKAYVERAR